MAYEKKTWKNRQSEYPNRRTLAPVDGQENTYDVTRAEGLVMEEGDPFDQESMNDLENRIYSGFADGGVNVYSHTRSGTVHEFTGTGANGRAKMTADVQAGDTFTVNGAPVTAYMGTDDAAGSMAGSAWNGKWVSFIVEGGTLNFKGGGGKVTVTGLTADAVKKGTTVTVKQGAKVVAEVTGTYKGTPCLCYGCIYTYPDNWNGTRVVLTSFDPTFVASTNISKTNSEAASVAIKRAANVTVYISGAGNNDFSPIPVYIDGKSISSGSRVSVQNGSTITVYYRAPGDSRARAGAFCIIESD